MATQFPGPEEVVIKQGEVGDNMYFIIQGDCTVNMVDYNRNTRTAFKLLVDGNMFGELAIIYNCTRTASIVSKNYNTLGFIDQKGFKDLTNDYPQILDMMKKHIYTYNEPRKQFYYKMVR